MANLVVPLLLVGGGAASIWAGIADPAGGLFAGLSSLMRGETPAKRTPDGSAIAATVALMNGGASATGLVTGPVATGANPAAKPSTYTSKLGPVRPHVAKAAAELGAAYGITNIGGYRSSGSRDPNGHPAGLALDFMVSDMRGGLLAAHALANRSRLRVLYVIWRQRINSGDGRGWRDMEDRGSPTQNHMDHVHISFNP